MKTLVLSLSLFLSAACAHAQSANLKTVTDNYARFGQGDIPGILATLADNVSWTHAGNHDLVPFAGTFNGPAGVGDFFQKVGASTQIVVFAPSDFRENGNMVSNTTHIEGKSVTTGKPYTSDVTMTWTFGPDGKVIRWEAAGDTSSLEAALSK